MSVCYICGKEFENNKFLSAHLKFEEHISSKDYYDTYLKQQNEGICIVCDKPTKYINLNRGYAKTCSQKCNNNPLSNKGKNISKALNSHTTEQKQEIKQKRENTCMKKFGAKSNLVISKCHSKESRQKAIETHKKHMLDGSIKGQNAEQSWITRKEHITKFCKENNCTLISDLLTIYGQGFLSLDLPRIYINKQNYVISNDYLTLIDEYFTSNQYSNKSKAEQQIIDNLDYKGTILKNVRSIIAPKELDIYMPDLKLAIEYNGIYWHSIERGCDKYMHRNKSIACKQLNIRLVHIFEFEDLNEQLYKLNQLIKGIDLFEKTFTKNNLIEIPKTEPIAIYRDSLHTIYGA